MKRAWILIVPAALLAILSTGCYTKFYRPGMEEDRPFGPEGQVYDRYDSTAIDTTLTESETQDEYYGYDSWSYWGHPYRPRWGFDFWDYTPGYYYGYYGYNNYYGTPWWHGYYDPWWGQPGYPTGPAEPPSKRDGRRGGRPSGSGGVINEPGPPSSSPTYAPPPSTSNPPPARKDPPKTEKKEDSNKRSGKRGR